MDYICTICTDSLEGTDDKAAVLRCGHTFHRLCITTCVDIFKKCPLCNLPSIKTHVKDIFLNSNTAFEAAEDIEAKHALKESRFANKYLMAKVCVQQKQVKELTVAKYNAELDAETAQRRETQLGERAEEFERKNFAIKKMQANQTKVLSEKVEKLKINVKQNEKEWLLRIKKRETEIAALNNELANLQEALDVQEVKTEICKKKIEIAEASLSAKDRDALHLTYQIKLLNDNKDFIANKATSTRS
ncbi:uncharacterized protein EV154DRAFT_480698 [Mucor mucedo]|uniref:uncharacterized protein n=1 Tax=Mucor mucedo TaxID=29922 RepID=UPI00221E5C77|nr:uncharacterized protein EV154DRAFT_480698 [Mucor mucedo]KAI7892088.1 hypothetical protein EV154DRAFT_480698 [Mucor mucedo]